MRWKNLSLVVFLLQIFELSLGKEDFFPYDICEGHASSLPFSVSSIESFSSPQRGEHDVIFNQRTQRFFIVWAEEKIGFTQLWGTHFDLDGQQGDSFPVSEDSIVAPIKRAPKVAYNNNTREYLIVFESPRIDGSTVELYTITVGDDDSAAERPNLLVRESEAEFSEVSVSYHPIIDEYLVATEKRGKSTQDKVAVNLIRISGRGIFMKVLLSFSGDQPHISINPSGFLVVSEDFEKTELQATFVQRAGTYSHTTIVISLDSNITLIHPQTIWSSVQNQFVLVYEESIDNGRKLVAQNIQLNGTYFGATGVKTYLEAKPSFEFYNFDMKYDSLYDNVVLVFEEDRTGDTSVSFIQTVVFSAQTHQIWKSIEISDSNNEHQPKVAVSDNSHILFVWSSGPEDAIDQPFTATSTASSSSTSIPSTSSRRKRQTKNDDILTAKFMCGNHYASLSRAEKTEIAAFVVMAALLVVVGVSMVIGLKVKQRPMIEHSKLVQIDAELELKEREIQRHQNEI
eukprot:TRINITY_DN3252_c0_g1_i4.p1 TRINITY_DN3252_c0_g1~~TRINITY_DN3252_c0_g1_i4.p1  ORF type:complete len:513 (+),score=122.08 TRINITY_DN3252_c0_g1_i4:163-1701(+)